MKICIDAGHGGSDPGTVGTSPFRLAEKTVALQISLLLEQELEERGHWVVMTRRTDRTLSLLARARFANRLKADLFASVHANAAASAAVEGMEVYHFPGSREGRRVAVAVLAGLVSAFPRHRNRGVKEANFAVLRETTMPAILACVSERGRAKINKVRLRIPAFNPLVAGSNPARPTTESKS